MKMLEENVNSILNEDGKEVLITLAGYITNKLCKRTNCDRCF